MSLSLILACLWALTACLIGLGPERFHWPAAWGLIAVGIPLLGYVTYEMGPWWGLTVLAAGISLLRWPVFYLGKWVKSQLRSS